MVQTIFLFYSGSLRMFPSMFDQGRIKTAPGATTICYPNICLYKLLLAKLMNTPMQQEDQIANLYKRLLEKKSQFSIQNRQFYSFFIQQLNAQPVDADLLEVGTLQYQVSLGSRKVIFIKCSFFIIIITYSLLEQYSPPVCGADSATLQSGCISM